MANGILKQCNIQPRSTCAVCICPPAAETQDPGHDSWLLGICPLFTVDAIARGDNHSPIPDSDSSNLTLASAASPMGDNGTGYDLQLVCHFHRHTARSTGPTVYSPMVNSRQSCHGMPIRDIPRLMCTQTTTPQIFESMASIIALQTQSCEAPVFRSF